MDFQDIWSNHQVELLGFIQSKVNDVHLSNDILQEVSIKLHEKLRCKTKIENIRAWIFQVTRNTIADHYRKLSNLKESNQMNFGLVSNTDTCVCDLSGFVIQNFLPEEYGKPLYLSDVEKMPQQEIANLLNISLTATKSRIQRGRKKLKELVEECVDINFNQKGQIADFKLKDGCVLPQELLDEMERINLDI